MLSAAKHLARVGLAVALLGCLAASPSGQSEGDRSPPVDEQPERTLVFVGDVMLARGVGAKMKAANDWTLPFLKIADTLRSADLAIANLECPVSDVGADRRHLYSFRADPNVLEGLKFAGFDVVSVANNHAYDWGEAALVDTLARLREAGIAPVGAGSNDLEAHYPVIRTVGDLRVGFLAYVNIEPQYARAEPSKPGVAWLDALRVVADVRFARPLVDILVVLPHWGVEYAPRPTPQQVKLARQIIDAGADLVVGTHPHVVQPVDAYGGGWIAYSLGNFVFDQKRAATRRGLMLRVRVREKRIAEVASVPIAINHAYQADLAPPTPPPPIAAPVRREPAALRAE